MSESKVIMLKKPGETSGNALTELLPIGARQLIAQAIEAELHQYLQQFSVMLNIRGMSNVEIFPTGKVDRDSWPKCWKS